MNKKVTECILTQVPASSEGLGCAARERGRRLLLS